VSSGVKPPAAGASVSAAPAASATGAARQNTARKATAFPVASPPRRMTVASEKASAALCSAIDPTNGQYSVGSAAMPP
jgi:hypothetical protein